MASLHNIPPAFVVTIAYWTLLASSDTFATPFSGTIRFPAVCTRLLTPPSTLAWDNTSVHILNSVFTLSEILLTFLGPIPWLYLPLCIFIIGLYIALAYVTYASQHFYRSFSHLFLPSALSVLIPLLYTKPINSSTRPSMVARLPPMCSVF